MVETKFVPVPAVTGPLDFSRPHLVGIGGAGMAPLAFLLAARGARVTGSDLRSTETTDRLKTAGVAVHTRHDAAHLDDPSVVVWSSALGTANAEVEAARRSGIPVVHRSQLLAHLMDPAAHSVVVAGTHGKSTTTGMLVTALGSRLAGWAGGAELVSTAASAAWGGGNVFVAEGDESDRSLVHLRPEVALVLNVDDDHPESYVDRAEAVSVFAEFARSARVLVTSADDDGAREVAAAVQGEVRTVTFGRTEGADVRVVGIFEQDGTTLVTLRLAGGDEQVLRLTVPGVDTAMDAVAAFTAGTVLGIEPGALAAGLGSFTGVARRMTEVGEAGGVRVRDSFAHHPRAIAGDLATARTLTDGRVIAVFQPSGWTRTAAYGDAIGAALADADEVVLLPVHSLLDSPIGQVSTDAIAASAFAHGARVHRVLDTAGAGRVASDIARPGDAVLVMGTGTVAEVGEMLLARLATLTAV